VTRRGAVLLLLLATRAAAPAVVELPNAAPLRFIVTGDAGATHSSLRDGMLAVSGRMHLDGILLVGDNFYPCGISGLADPQWTKITSHFGPTHLPIYPILGNHDYGDQQERRGGADWTCGHPDPGAEVSATGRITNWNFPARNYLLRSPLVDIAMLDTQPIALDFTTSVAGSSTAGEEVSWLIETLGAMDSRWRIVVGHHTIYSSGMHGRKNDATQRRMRALLPILRQNHVDLYVCGHDHDLELIGDAHDANTPLFLVSGAGSGVDDMRPRKAAGEPATIYPRMPAKTYLGFAVLEIAENQLTITFYDRAGTQTAGPFTMTK
jgi:tartrate-resistant acid phosphatase type 5